MKLQIVDQAIWQTFDHISDEGMSMWNNDSQI